MAKLTIDPPAVEQPIEPEPDVPHPLARYGFRWCPRHGRMWWLRPRVYCPICAAGRWDSVLSKRPPG